MEKGAKMYGPTTRKSLPGTKSRLRGQDHSPRRTGRSEGTADVTGVSVPATSEGVLRTTRVGQRGFDAALGKVVETKRRRRRAQDQKGG
jgi:hypothetical protein